MEKYECVIHSILFDSGVAALEHHRQSLIKEESSLDGTIPWGRSSKGVVGDHECRWFRIIEVEGDRHENVGNVCFSHGRYSSEDYNRNDGTKPADYTFGDEAETRSDVLLKRRIRNG